MRTIQQETRNLVKKFNTNNPFLLCSYNNIICLEQSLHKDINGFAIYSDNIWVITINKSLSVSEKIFTCAHELGHILLHKEYSSIYLSTKSSISRTDKDIDADIFSASLLIPKIASLNVNNYTIKFLAYKLNVPLYFLKIRLKLDGFTELPK